MTDTDTISIARLSDISSEALRASGPLGQVYDLQLAYDIAEQRYAETVYEVEHDLPKVPPLGSSTIEMFEQHPAIIEGRAILAATLKAMKAAQAEVGGIVFLPAVQNVPEIEKRLVALNKKAAKIGSEPITLTISDEKLILNYKTSNEPGFGDDFEHVFAVLAGTTPKIPGFEFIASVTTTDAGNVIKRIPSFAYSIRHNLQETTGATALESIDLSRFHTTGSICEHCGLERTRNETFVIYNEETGESKQVGRTCLREFTGRNNPEQILKVLEQVWEFMRSISDGSHQAPMLSTEMFLTHCAAMMRDYGGYRKGLGHDAANNEWLMANQKKDRQGAPLWIEPTEVDETAAKNILAWVGEWDETSEFATNVKIALGSHFIDSKLHGFGGAAFIAYEKWMGRERERKAVTESPKAHIGTVGQRETFTLTVTQIRWIEDRYSYNGNSKPLFIMEDTEGNEVKWFASNLPRVADSDTPPEIGGTYQVKGTVKKHEDHERFGKSTVITRCKFEQTVSVAA